VKINNILQVFLQQCVLVTWRKGNIHYSYIWYNKQYNAQVSGHVHVNFNFHVPASHNYLKLWRPSAMDTLVIRRQTDTCTEREILKTILLVFEW